MSALHATGFPNIPTSEYPHDGLTLTDTYNPVGRPLRTA
jgi:hypothetical protein